MNREEASNILRDSTGGASPMWGDSLVISRGGQFEFVPFALAPVTTVTSSYSVSGDDVVILADAAGGAISINLPGAYYAQYRVLIVKKIDSSANAATVVPIGTEKIDGASSKVLSTQWDSLMIVSDGYNWYIISEG